MTSKERKDKFSTISGIELKRFYLDSSSTHKKGETETPGQFPYTRGIHDTMYRGRLWTMRQYAGFGSPKETNNRYRYLLAQGTTGLSVAFDLPTQMGRDSDHPISKGEVGRVGVAISTVEDMEILFREIPLSDVSISMTINSTASILLAFLLVIAKRNGVDWNKLRGTIQNDVLKEYIARGTYVYPPKHALRIATDIFSFCSKKVPHWNTISVSGYHMREAGSTAPQEVGFTLANGIAYVDAAIKAGLAVDDFAPRIAFFFNCHNDFLEEIAKFRAARRLWAKIMKERFAAKSPASMMLRFHTQTAGSSLTAQQPYNNIIRTTLQAMAAVIGGTQSLHTNSFDEALGLPTERAATIALRTQQIIANESGVPNSVDPLAGSYLVEELTNEIENRANGIIQKIDAIGGMVKAIEVGYPQLEIHNAAFDYQSKIEKRELEIVGVNCFKEEETKPPPVLKIDPQLEIDQVERLSKFKKGRDLGRVGKALQVIRDTANGSGNIMEAILDGAESGCSLGEMSDVMRDCFGEYDEVSIL